MKIYEVRQNDVNGYDTYDSAVIIAESVENAKRISIKKLHSNWGFWTDDVSKIKF